MCCFSQPIESVSSTNIFARRSSNNKQFLVYQMEYHSEVPNAMILPLPVANPNDEDALRFITLEEYDNFFEDLAVGFPEIRPQVEWSRSLPRETKNAMVDTLKVVEVGSYIASFVPNRSDFAKLDPRFVIASEIWDQLPQYRDYAFAVFQLSSLEGKPHPMGIEFSTANSDQLFFPTVHIHDGQVHAMEEFDHMLYLQDSSFDKLVGDYVNRDVIDPSTQWARSDRPANRFCNLDLSQSMVDPSLLVHRKRLSGMLKNSDTIVSFSELPTQRIAKSRGAADTITSGLMRFLGGTSGAILGAGVVGAGALAWIIGRRAKLNRSPETKSNET